MSLLKWPSQADRKRRLDSLWGVDAKCSRSLKAVVLGLVVDKNRVSKLKNSGEMQPTGHESVRKIPPNTGKVSFFFFSSICMKGVSSHIFFDRKSVAGNANIRSDRSAANLFLAGFQRFPLVARDQEENMPKLDFISN